MVTSEVFILPLFVNVAIQHDTAGFDHSCTLVMILKNPRLSSSSVLHSFHSNFDSSNECGRFGNFILS